MTRFRSDFRRIAVAGLLGLSLTGLGACANVVDGISNGEPRAGSLPKYRGFDGFVQPLNGPVRLDVAISEELMKLADGPGPRNYGSRRLRDGFATGGYLGLEALEELQEEAAEEMTEQLAKRGVGIDGDSDTILRLRIVDARPSRPTFSQLSKEPSLSSSSRARGGISFEGELVSATTGEPLGQFTYGDYDDFITPTGGIWSDANQGIDMLARRLAKQLTPLSGKEL